MGVHSNVITGDQLTIVNTVIATRVLLTDTDHHQTLFTGDDVLLRTERDSVATLGLAVVMPLCATVW